ncbi:MAG: rhamnulokinase [Spirochaetaceae bacterium]|nr:rhamnulokinase [Spirochaetaceae bacterium]
MNGLGMLAIDLGASNGRAILGRFDGSRLELEEIHRFANEPVKVAGHLFWDILRLYHEIGTSVSILTSRKADGLDSLGIDSWGVDYGLLDSRGLLLGNPYHYRDARTEHESDRAFGLVPKRDIYFETGISFEKFNTLFQLLAENESGDALERAESLLFMPDLLAYFLTGEKGTDSTLASTSQLVDARKQCWSSSLLSALHIPAQIMPAIAAPGSPKGRISGNAGEGLGIAGLPVITVSGHDTASALAAVPSRGADTAFISSGTWSLMGVEVEKPIITEQTFTLNYSNEKCFGGYSLLRNIMGAWLIQECKRKWEDEEGRSISYDELNEAARQSQPLSSFIDPNSSMFYLPGDMPEKAAEYCRLTGQKIPRTKGEITRCIYESLALKYRQSFTELESILGRRLSALHIIGGGANNVMLNQFTANAIGKPVISGPVEATAIGNILVQAIALGELGGLSQLREVVRNSFTATTFVPGEPELWEEAYNRFIMITEKGSIP